MTLSALWPLIPKARRLEIGIKKGFFRMNPFLMPITTTQVSTAP